MSEGGLERRIGLIVVPPWARTHAAQDDLNEEHPRKVPRTALWGASTLIPITQLAYGEIAHRKEEDEAETLKAASRAEDFYSNPAGTDYLPGHLAELVAQYGPLIEPPRYQHRFYER